MDTKAKIKCGVKGYYSLKKLNARGDTVDAGPIKTVNNTVSTAGAIAVLSAGSLFSSMRARVGTGVTELTANSTDLTSPLATYTGVASANRAGSEIDNGDGTSTVVLTREMPFQLGAAVGTFSEVGTYLGDTYVAGQLIKDELGNPTTITILADEQLVVTYTLEWTVPNKSTLLGTGTLTDSASNTYDYELWGQPYFCVYTPGSSDKSIRTGSKNTRWCSMDGIDRGSITSSGSTGITVSGNTFTRTFSTNTIPPNGATFTDAGFFRFGDSSGAPINLAGGVTDSNTSSSYTPIIVKLLTPMTKTNQESFSLGVSIEYTV